MKKAPTKTQTQRTMAVAGDLRILVGQLKRRLREQASPGDLTLAQISVLHHLEREGPATITTLARLEGMRSQSMSANVAVLQTAGFVRGSPDPADGRQTLLSMTAACREWIAANHAARESWLFHAIQSRLSPAEQLELTHAVGLLKRLVES